MCIAAPPARGYPRDVFWLCSHTNSLSTAAGPWEAWPTAQLLLSIQRSRRLQSLSGQK